MNVGDFKSKKRGHNQGNEWLASTLHCSVSFLEVMWRSVIVHVAPETKMHSKKRRGRLNDMIWLYCSACGECSRKVTLSCHGCRDKRGVDCSWHYITRWLKAFMHCQTEKLRTNKKDIQKFTSAMTRGEQQESSHRVSATHKFCKISLAEPLRKENFSEKTLS